MSKTKSSARLFLWPLLIGILSAIGLISALVGNGILDLLSWLLLTVPVATGGALSLRRR